MNNPSKYIQIFPSNSLYSRTLADKQAGAQYIST